MEALQKANLLLEALKVLTEEKDNSERIAIKEMLMRELRIITNK